MRGIHRLKRIYQRTRRHLVRGAVILMYHRVTNLPQDPYLLAVSPENFSDHLRHIQETCTVLSLDELVVALDQNKLPSRAIALTFDDCYGDTYREALPLLQAAGVPATVFVASGQIGKQREYWWDNLERILLLPNHLPEKLSLNINGVLRTWTLLTQSDRDRVRVEIHGMIKPLVSHQREAILDDLAVWAGLSLEGRPQYYALDCETLLGLAASPLITIGAHTITHASLAHLPVDIQQQEMNTSRAMLEDWLDQSVDTFAYPYGKAEDYTPDTVRLARDTGFKLACTSICGSLEPGDNHFELNRCGVHNWSIDLFRKKLEYFFYV